MSSYPDISPKTMTSNTAPSPYVASSPSSFDPFLPWRCFDSDPNTSYWLGTAGPPRSFTIDLGAMYLAHDYAVKVNTIPEAARAPKDWTFEGSVDNTNWTTLDTVTNATSWGNGETREYACEVLSYFRYFKLSITANNGDGTYTQCASFFIYGERMPGAATYISSSGHNRLAVKQYSSLARSQSDAPIPFITKHRNRLQRTGVSTSGFVPNPWKFSGLLWGMKADDLTGNDTDLIASVADKGPYGYTLTQTTDANKPTLHTNEINGRKALYFDGGDKMDNASATNLITNIFTFWAVASRSLDAYMAIVQIGPGGFGSGRYLRFDANHTASLLCSSIEGIGSTTTVLPHDGSWHTIIVSHNATTGAYQFYVDSVTDNGGTNTTTYSASGTHLTLGWTPDGGAPEYLTGYIAEVGMLNHAITVSELLLLKRYFKREYNL